MDSFSGSPRKDSVTFSQRPLMQLHIRFEGSIASWTAHWLLCTAFHPPTSLALMEMHMLWSTLNQGPFKSRSSSFDDGATILLPVHKSIHLVCLPLTFKKFFCTAGLGGKLHCCLPLLCSCNAEHHCLFYVWQNLKLSSTRNISLHNMKKVLGQSGHLDNDTLFSKVESQMHKTDQKPIMNL